MTSILLPASKIPNLLWPGALVAWTALHRDPRVAVVVSASDSWATVARDADPYTARARLCDLSLDLRRPGGPEGVLRWVAERTDCAVPKAIGLTWWSFWDDPEDGETAPVLCWALGAGPIAYNRARVFSPSEALEDPAGQRW